MTEPRDPKDRNYFTTSVPKSDDEDNRPPWPLEPPMPTNKEFRESEATWTEINKQVRNGGQGDV